jgi:hypothetical protein
MMPGHTANRGGRPRGSRGMLTLFNDKRDEKISLKVDGQVTKMTRLEAWVTNLWNKAIACDPKASAMVLAIMRVSGQLEPAPGEERELSENDALAFAALVRRLSGEEPDNE